eukprot:scaffold353211_cov27-Prasinocladus_malaysianus.AAC.1
MNRKKSSCLNATRSTNNCHPEAQRKINVITTPKQAISRRALACFWRARFSALRPSFSRQRASNCSRSAACPAEASARCATSASTWP